MSLFGSPISQSVGASEAAQRAQARELAKRTPQSGGRTRAIADTVEILIESAEAVDPSKKAENDLKDRGAKERRKRRQTSANTEADRPTTPRLDVQG
jgi:hypothetical protein